MSSFVKPIVLCIFIMSSLLLTYVLSVKSSKPIIAITQIVAHPSLDKIRMGIMDELKDAGFISGKNCQVVYDNAHGDMAIATQIAQKFKSLSPAVIIAIATPSAQTVMKSIKGTTIPMVFGAVTDPVGAQLIPSMDGPFTTVIGTVDHPSPRKQLKEILRIIPSLKILAIACNPTEMNSVKQVHELKSVLKESKINYVEILINRSSEVSTSLYAHISTADALFIPNDNMVISALDAVLKVTNSLSIPVFTSDPESVERGALAAIANDQYLVGRETGKLAVRILKGIDGSKLGVVKVDKVKTYTNDRLFHQKI